MVWKRVGLMAVMAGVVLGGFAAAPRAEARVFFGVGFGVPIYAPPPVYYAPPPVYYRTVVYPPRVVYRRVWVHHAHHVVHRSCGCGCP